MSAWLIPVALFVCGSGMWLYGYHIGTRDTERRWSDAVARAEAHRQWEAERENNTWDARLTAQRRREREREIASGASPTDTNPTNGHLSRIAD